MSRNFSVPLSRTPAQDLPSSPILGRAPARLLVLLLAAGWGLLWATGVPFGTEHSVDTDFDGASAVLIADVNGDGDPDVIGAAFDADDVSWWENTAGDGTAWTEHSIDADFDGASAVFAADVDGDGDLDVLGAASEANDISWWENTAGDGTAWTEHSVDADFGGARGVFAADIDGDGDLDVIGAGETADDISWWENTAGDGTAWTEHPIDADFDGASAVFAADVDGDGDLDVIGAAFDADDVSWWENTAGDGTAWTEHPIDADFDGARSVSVADVDGDGDLDVIGAAFDADDVSWWENTAGDGTTWTEHLIDADFDGARSVSAVDVDGDGDLDVIGAGESANDISWWENTAGNGTTWTEHSVDTEFGGASSAAAVDVDGDGDTDIFGAALSDDDVVWWENETIHRSALFPIEHAIDADFDGATSVIAADVDGDGDLDVIGAAFDADDISWWENTAGNGTAWIEHPIDTDFDGARSVFEADVDGDGDLDVIGAAFEADDVSWWENTAGDGTAWTEHAVDADFDGARAVSAADIDGDGDTDILGAAFLAGDVVWWENTAGDGTAWTEHIIDSDFLGAARISAADLDGDGDLDVASASVGGLFVILASWHNSDGAGTVWVEQSPSAATPGIILFPSDLDGDGDIDWLGAMQSDDDVGWLEFPSFAVHTIDDTFVGVAAIFPADMDGDGDLDALAAADVDDDIAWWENRGGQFALPTTSTAPANIAPPSQAVVLRINPVHKGRTGDTDVEIVTIELLFDDGVTPLTDGQANSAIDMVRVYRDDGSGAFDASDTMVGAAGPLSLTAGVQTISFVDNDMNAQFAFGAAPLFFVVIDFEAGATFNPLRVTHLTESSSSGEDADHDIPLKLEYLPNVSTPEIVILGGPGAGSGCPSDLVLADQGLSGTQTIQATTSATLGENLTIDGTSIAVNAPAVTILANTSIGGTFSISNTPSCP